MLNILTSEAVTEGHPDKLCDQISDGILDAFLEKDENSRVAVEAMVSKNTLFIAGEITSSAKVDIVKTAKNVAKNIGYDSDEKGFNADNCLVFTNISEQSPDIAMGVLQNGQIGAGDQGIMYGYACNESPDFLPLPFYIANKLAKKLAYVRKSGFHPWIFPDGKTQVTVCYSNDGKPLYIKSIVVSAHHEEGTNPDYLKDCILNDVVYASVDDGLIKPHTQILINPTGNFSVGGPLADTGVTGRKLMADTYGTVSHHGGGAFSGKDPTKVDRSGAYMARYAAKNIVAAGLCDKCEVAVAYAIGQAEPEAVSVNTFGTGKICEKSLENMVKEVFSFSVGDILNNLELRKPQYLATAAYGHFGNARKGHKWEMTDKAQTLKQLAVDFVTKSFA